jgi:serine/threonine protein kinase
MAPSTTHQDAPANEDAKVFQKAELPRGLGRYVLLKLLARGGMGEVYLASTTGLEGAEKAVVVKVIRREHVSDPSFYARFLDEARVQAQLSGTGVAQIVDAAMDDETGEPYVVIEHVEGRSLGDVRARLAQVGERLAWAEAVALATMMAEALAHVHERTDAAGRALSIVHRDLSPQNVMLSYEGELKLIDFGTARGENRRCHTVAGVVFAKPGYVAPEVANGNTGDARVDLYALGVILWELCAGRRFLQGDAAEHMAKVAKREAELPPIAASLGAPAELDQVLARLTAFDRETRSASARAAAGELAKLLAHAPGLASGERSVRARAASVMARLFPSEPSRTRREFAKLVSEAHVARRMAKTPHSRAPENLARRREDDEAGLLAGTRYELLRELGRGATSVVYEARHVELGRRVAIKVLAEKDTASKTARARFQREATALSRLTDPASLQVLDYGVTPDDRPYCIMELLTGETLDVVLARKKTLPYREALGIAEKALSALAAAHAVGIVHRDVKPSNLFLTEAGEVKLLDFGLARTAGEDDASEVGDESLAGLTVFGTPEYMAPEQVASGRVDARADLYALGCVVYEMIAGGLPFVREGAVALLDAKVKGSPERLRERAADKALPKAVDELVMRAVARHPSLRFESAEAMRKAIRKLAEGEGRSRSRVRLFAYAALASFCALAVLGLVGRKDQLAAAKQRVFETKAELVARFFGPEEVSAPVAELPPAELAAPSEPAPAAAALPVAEPPAPVVVEPPQPAVAPAAVMAALAAPEAPKAAVPTSRPRKSERAEPKAKTVAPERAAKKAKSEPSDRRAKDKDKKRARSKSEKGSAAPSAPSKAKSDGPVDATESAPSAAPAGLEPLPASDSPASAPANGVEPTGPADRIEDARRKKHSKKRVAQVR